jgi:hypothetical protein
VLIVGIDGAAVEADLVNGRICCPGCTVGLRPWGHGIEREVRLLGLSERRRPRRSICRACAVTHVLVPEDTLLRRRDGVEVIGAALVAKARGQGHRRVHVGRGIIDRWARVYRSGGFEALAPVSRTSEPVTEKRLLDLAEALKREVPRRTAAQVSAIIRTTEGAGPAGRTLQRHCPPRAQHPPRRLGAAGLRSFRGQRPRGPVDRRRSARAGDSREKDLPFRLYR